MNTCAITLTARLFELIIYRKTRKYIFSNTNNVIPKNNNLFLNFNRLIRMKPDDNFPMIN